MLEHCSESLVLSFGGNDPDFNFTACNIILEKAPTSIESQLIAHLLRLTGFDGAGMLDASAGLNQEIWLSFDA